MTRKKIDLSLATEDWLKAEHYTARDGTFREEQYRRSWDYELGYASDPNHRDHAAAKDKSIKERYISDHLLDYTSIDGSYIEPTHGKITLFCTGSFDAKGLNKLMNSEIHHDGLVFTFDALRLKSSMSGDVYMGEYNESPRAQFEIGFKSPVTSRGTPTL